MHFRSYFSLSMYYGTFYPTTLRAPKRHITNLDPRPHSSNSLFQVPTLLNFINLAFTMKTVELNKFSSTWLLSAVARDFPLIVYK